MSVEVVEDLPDVDVIVTPIGGAAAPSGTSSRPRLSARTSKSSACRQPPRRLQLLARAHHPARADRHRCRRPRHRPPVLHRGQDAHRPPRRHGPRQRTGATRRRRHPPSHRPRRRRRKRRRRHRRRPPTERSPRGQEGRHHRLRRQHNARNSSVASSKPPQPSFQRSALSLPHWTLDPELSVVLHNTRAKHVDPPHQCGFNVHNFLQNMVNKLLDNPNM